MNLGKLSVLAMLFLLGFICSSVTYGSSTVDWQAAYAGSYLYDANSNALSGDLLLQLVVDPGANTDFVSMQSTRNMGIGSDTTGWLTLNSATDDYVVATGTWMDGGGIYGSGGSSPVTNSTVFYFRWFDTSVYGPSAQVGIMYSTNNSWISPASDLNTTYAYFDYTDPNTIAQGVRGTEYTAGSNDGWQTVVPVPVPEPGTWILFAMGALTMGLRKRFCASKK